MNTALTPMSPPAATPAPSPREDVLVSVCFGELPPDPAAFAAVAALSERLALRFRFAEIVVVAEEALKDAYLPLVGSVDTLRLFTVRSGTGFYRRRVIAAGEAIGDAVLMASAPEIAHLDPVAMLGRAADEDRAIQGWRAAGALDRVFGAPLVMLGRIAGFAVDLRALQTLALPRTLLNHLLAHPDPDLALRFPPRDVRVPCTFVEAGAGLRGKRADGQHGRRLALLQKLLVHLAPSLLWAVTLASALLAAMGAGYGVYALGAWLVVDDLAPGWLTLSVMLSLTAFFLGISITGLSLGLQQLLARAERDGFDGVTSEVNRVDLFGRVAAELNVALERGSPERGGPAER